MSARPPTPSSAAPPSAAGVGGERGIEALDVMLAADADASSVTDLLGELDTIERMERKLAAAKAKRLAAYDHRRAYRPAFRSASTAVAHRRRISGRRAGAQVNVARALRALPIVLAALADATISVEHAERIAALYRRPHLRAAVIEDQEWFVEQAAALAWTDFAFRVDNWAELADPRDPHDLDPAADKRRLAWAFGVGGTGLAELTTTTLLLEQLVTMLQPTFDELLAEEWATVRAARIEAGLDPDDAHPSDLPRIDSMRWHDALMIVLRRGAGALGGSDASNEGDPGASVSVGITVDLATLEAAAEVWEGGTASRRDRCADAIDYRCETLSGHRVPPQLALWCSLADEIRRVTLNLEDRSASLSHKGRFFNRGQSTAMTVRDRHCRGPGCCRYGSLQADHVIPASRGGATHTSNGNMLCAPCHRHKTWLQAMGLWAALGSLWNPNAEEAER